MQMKHKTETADGQAITWTTLVKHEPQLKALLADARSITDNRSKTSFCANAAWYGYGGRPGLKPRLLFLVGWERGISQKRGSTLAVVNLAGIPLPPKADLASLSEGEQVLRSQGAYDLAYHTVYDVLPNCRNCGCM